jgi:hypothetical protein
MSRPINELNAAGRWEKMAEKSKCFYYNPWGKGEWDEIDAKAQRKSLWFWIIVAVVLLIAAITFS